MAVTENSMSYTDSHSYSLNPREGVDTWGVYGYTHATAKSDNCKKNHRLGRTDGWQGQSLQNSHAPNSIGRRRNETILAVMSQWIVEHQVGML